jgi:predicted PurR-regulated permease PerM
MSDFEFDASNPRGRVGWWLFIGLLALLAGYIAYSFVGLLALGVFGYYATRPIYDEVDEYVDSDSMVAWATVLIVLVPIFLLALYTTFQAFTQVQQFLATGSDLPGIASNLPTDVIPGDQRRAVTSLLQDPQQLVSNPRDTVGTLIQTGLTVLSAVVGTLLFLALAVTLSYFLLKNDEEIGAGLEELFGGRDTSAYAYARAVDEDLESVFFGDLLFVIAMTVIAAVVYSGTNVLAPSPLQVPQVFALAFFTGVASLIPIVVGKVVYLPVVGFLAWQAVTSSGNQLPFVGGALVVYFLTLDILPQTFLQPYLSGRELDMMLLMFAYLLGPVLFGWYGFFLLPIILVVMLEAVRIPLPELLHGEPLTQSPSLADSVGSTPDVMKESPAESDGATEPPDGEGSTDTAADSG